MVMESILNYVDGEFADPASGDWLDNVEPATGKVYSRVADSGAEDVERAVEAASHAFPSWSATPVGQRARLLLSIADQIERESEIFARAESIDSGKPRMSLRAAFANQGQICLCGSRIYVERTIYDQFVERFTTQARALPVGDPLSLSTQQGALVSADHRDKVLSYVALAKEEGGTVLCGGRAPQPADLPERCRGGFFVEPTVIVDLPAGCRVNREEIFGPVVSIAPFDSEREAVDLANDTPYGLAASIWTRDLARAHRLADLVDAGTVWINCWMLRDLRVPFGGTKASGVGREGGSEALRFFTEPKNVCIHYSSTLPD